MKLINNYNKFLHLFLGQNFFTIDAHSTDKSSQKVSVLYCKYREIDVSICIHIYALCSQTDRQIINRIDAHQMNHHKKRIRPLS